MKIDGLSLSLLFTFLAHLLWRLDEGKVAAAGLDLPLDYFDDLKQPLDGALLIEGDDLGFVLR